MTMNLHAIVAVAGCIALFGFWFTNAKSGFRGFLFVCTGCILLFLAYEGQEYLSSLATIALACVVLALLLFSLSTLARARRQPVPRSHPPMERSGMCSSCAQSAQLKHYQQGWLCATCARCINAKGA